MQAMDFEVAKKAFIRLRDVQSVDVLSEIEMRSIHEAALAKNPEARCAHSLCLCVKSIGYNGRGGVNIVTALKMVNKALHYVNREA